MLDKIKSEISMNYEICLVSRFHRGHNFDHYIQ